MSLLSRLERNRHKDTALEQDVPSEAIAASAASVEEPPIPETSEEAGDVIRRATEEGANAALQARYALKYSLFDDVLNSLDPQMLRQPQQTTLSPAITKPLNSIAQARGLSLSVDELHWLHGEFLQEFVGFGPITPFLEDSGISKIFVNGHQEVVVERAGRAEITGVTLRDNDHLLNLIRRIADELGSRIDSKVPLLDRPLPEGARVRAKVPPLAPHPSLIIEKKGGNPFETLQRQQSKPLSTDTQPIPVCRAVRNKPGKVR